MKGDTLTQIFFWEAYFLSLTLSNCTLGMF